MNSKIDRHKFCKLVMSNETMLRVKGFRRRVKNYTVQVEVYATGRGGGGEGGGGVKRVEGWEVKLWTTLHGV